MLRSLSVLSVLLLGGVSSLQVEPVLEFETRLHHPEHYKKTFEAWMSTHGIEFHSQDALKKAHQAFVANSDLIEEHNSNSKHTFKLAHNEFSHLTWEEFRSQMLGYQPRGAKFGKISDYTDADIWSLLAKREINNALTIAADERKVSELPGSVDWVKDGAVTPVKNQGLCGSCWSFSAVGAMEGALAISTGQLIDLSEEQVLDCDKTDGACGGGEMETAFDWIKLNKGVCSAADYPYTGILPLTKTCKLCDPVPGTAISGYATVDSNEEAIKKAVYAQPLAVGIEADQLEFQFYSSGVFKASCGTNLDHGVVLVGYGTDKDTGLDFWKIKNSWGESWGLNGYILLSRQGDECGVMLDATFPILESSPMLQGKEQSSTAHDCGGGTIVFTDVTLEPEVPKRGKPVNMVATGTLSKATPSGTVNLTVSLNGMEVYGHQASACGDSVAELPLGLGHLKLHGLECPSEPGAVTYKIEVNLPSIAPPGNYVIELKGVDADGVELLCLHSDLKL